MPEQRLTPAQYRVLEEIEAGRVVWGQRGTESTVFPPAVRSDVVARLRRRDLVAVQLSRAYVLTDKGREALAQHRSHL
jgi:hypothetical protein